MKKLLSLLLIFLSVQISISQTSENFNLSNISELKLSDKSYNILNSTNSTNFFQLKKRKTVTSYFGAGYSFVIFTSGDVNSAYPVFDTRKGDFLSEINLFFGFAIAKAVTLEFEPAILFTNNERIISFKFSPPINKGGEDWEYVHPQALSLLAFPLAINARFFPAYRTKGFTRLFFVGGGLGAAWIREEYDNYYNNNPGGPQFNESFIFTTESTSQWQPLFRIMTGFTGTGGQFGFGGELRYNIIPLSEERQPFVTRVASNFNSVDITLRFYFSL